MGQGRGGRRGNRDLAQRGLGVPAPAGAEGARGRGRDRGGIGRRARRRAIYPGPAGPGRGGAGARRTRRRGGGRGGAAPIRPAADRSSQLHQPRPADAAGDRARLDHHADRLRRGAEAGGSPGSAAKHPGGGRAAEPLCRGSARHDPDRGRGPGAAQGLHRCPRPPDRRPGAGVAAARRARGDAGFPPLADPGPRRSWFAGAGVREHPGKRHRL